VVHDSEGPLGILLSIHEKATKERARRVADRSYLYTRSRNGNDLPSLYACINTHIARKVSARVKALPLEVKFCRLKFTCPAKGLVRFTPGRSLVTAAFDIATS